MRGLIIGFLIVLLSACSSTTAKKQPTASNIAAACKDNPYLMKYNCSVEKIQSAAESGDPDAQYALGYMYYYGVGTVRDPQTGRLWITKSADQGQTLAQSALKLMDNTKTTTVASTTSLPQTTTVIAANKPAIENNTSPQLQTRNNLSAAQVQSRQAVVVSDPRLNPGAVPNRSIAQQNARKNKRVHAAVKAKPNAAVMQSIRGDEQHLLSMQANAYTLQLMGNHRYTALKRFVASHNLQGKVSFYETQFQNRPWYMVVYGEYASRALARQAIATLPANLKRFHPWAKSFKVVKQEIKTRRLVA